MTTTLPKPILPPAIQKQLAMAVPRFRPLSDVKTVLRDLGQFDIDAEQIGQLVEQGVMLGFDISLHGKGGGHYLNKSLSSTTKEALSRITRKITYGAGDDGRTAKCCLRVLTASIEFFSEYGGMKYHELEWPKIFKLIVPHTRPVLTGLEIRRTLICDRGHVENLIHAGCLTSLQKSKPGPGGSWTISRDSFENFLKGRLQ